MTQSTFYLGNSGTVVYSGHAEVRVSTVGTEFWRMVYNMRAERVVLPRTAALVAQPIVAKIAECKDRKKWLLESKQSQYPVKRNSHEGLVGSYKSLEHPSNGVW